MSQSQDVSQDSVELVMRGAFRRVALGLALGLPLAVGAGRLISAQLYGVAFWDPLALTVAATRGGGRAMPWLAMVVYTSSICIAVTAMP